MALDGYTRRGVL